MHRKNACAPVSPGVRCERSNHMGLLSWLFRRRHDGDPVMQALIREEKKRRSLLDAPDLSISFQCECGRYLSIGLRESFNVLGGCEVICAHCQAVTLLAPEILDHSQYDSRFGSASLRENWRDMIKVVKHGQKT